jgi:hypothetical protein
MRNITSCEHVLSARQVRKYGASDYHRSFAALELVKTRVDLGYAAG